MAQHLRVNEASRTPLSSPARENEAIRIVRGLEWRNAGHVSRKFRSPEGREMVEILPRTQPQTTPPTTPANCSPPLSRRAWYATQAEPGSDERRRTGNDCRPISPPPTHSNQMRFGNALRQSIPKQAEGTNGQAAGFSSFLPPLIGTAIDHREERPRLLATRNKIG